MWTLSLQRRRWRLSAPSRGPDLRGQSRVRMCLSPTGGGSGGADGIGISGGADGGSGGLASSSTAYHGMAARDLWARSCVLPFAGTGSCKLPGDGGYPRRSGCDLLVMEMLLEVERGTRLMAAALATGLPVWAGISTSRGSGGQMIGWDIASEEYRLPAGRLRAGGTRGARDDPLTHSPRLSTGRGHHAQLIQVHHAGPRNPL